MGADQGLIPDLAGVAGHHKELRGRKPGHGDIRLDPTPFVQELGVNRGANRHIHFCTGHEIQRMNGIGALHDDLAIHRLIDQHRIFGSSLGFGRDKLRPILPAQAGPFRPALARRIEIHRNFPADAFGHHRAFGQQLVVQGHPADTACRRDLTARPLQAIVEADGFLGPLGVVGKVALERMRTRGQHRADSAHRHPVGHPCRHRQAKAAAIQDTVRIHARCNEQTGHFRRRAKIGAAIGRKAFRPVEEGVNARGLKEGKAREGAFQHRLDMLHVKGQFVEFERLGDATPTPCLALGFKPADQKFARVFFGVKPLFGHDQARD